MQLLDKAAQFFEEREELDLSLIGPLFMLLTLGLGFAFSERLDLIFLSSLGLYFSAKWQMKGCSYALIVLSAVGLLAHLFWLEEHLWHLGLEFSLAFSFFITALSFEEKKSVWNSLDAKLETKEATISHLEQDLLELQNAASEEGQALRRKIELLEKELEESTLEQSSLCTLNDVLRKKAAALFLEKEAWQKREKDLQREFVQLQNELLEMSKELKIWKDEEALSLENRQLLKDLNALRVEKEQLTFDLDSFAVAKEKEGQRAAECESQMELLISEKALLEARLEKKEKEMEELSQEWQRFSREKAELQTECKAIRQEKEALAVELMQKGEEVVLQETLKKRLIALEEMERLYRQLKAQFQEKDAILHETRASLFQKETELEALQIERKEVDLPFSFEEMEKELETLEREMTLLKQENHELSELISKLSQLETAKAPSKRKKKQTQTSFI